MACVGKLLIRIALAVIFIPAGWYKLNNLEAVNGFMQAQFGLPMLGTLVGLVEFVGGLFVLVGYQTFAAALLLTVVMAVATLKVHFVQGWEGMKLTTILGLVSLGIAFIGAGRYSVAKCLCKGKTCSDC